MPHIAERAIVIGVGMGGLAAARALSPHFRQVTVIERDSLPTRAEPRPGTPDVHKIWQEVIHLLRPPTDLRDPDLVRRVKAVMAERTLARPEVAIWNGRPVDRRSGRRRDGRQITPARPKPRCAGR